MEPYKDWKNFKLSKNLVRKKSNNGEGVPKRHPLPSIQQIRGIQFMIQDTKM